MELSVSQKVDFDTVRDCLFQTRNILDVTDEQIYTSFEKYEYTVPPSLKQLNDISKHLKYDLKEFYKFRGNYLVTWGWLLWLQKELKDVQVCLMANVFTRPALTWNDKNSKLDVSEDVIEQLESCQKHRFVISDFTIITKGGRHANALIFDTFSQTVTRFEPHGAMTLAYGAANLENALRRWLAHATYKLGWDKFKYYSPPDYCPRLGPQSRESWRLVPEAMATKKVFGKEVLKETQGYCAAWSLLFVHMRLLNPDSSNAKISKYFDELTDQQLSIMIRKYAEFIVRTLNSDFLSKKSTIAKVGDAFTAEFKKRIEGIVLERLGKVILFWSVSENKIGTVKTSLIDYMTVLKEDKAKHVKSKAKEQAEYIVKNKLAGYVAIVKYADVFGIDSVPIEPIMWKVGDFFMLGDGKTFGIVKTVSPFTGFVVSGNRKQRLFYINSEDAVRATPQIEMKIRERCKKLEC